MASKNPTHPIQPLVMVDNVLRFKENEIVSDLLKAASAHGMNMNDIARKDYTKEDRQQFAQLIGYSLCGYSELGSYVDDEAYAAAEAMHRSGKPELQARVDYLRGELNAIRKALRKPIARLFEKHPDDLKPE